MNIKIENPNKKVTCAKLQKRLNYLNNQKIKKLMGKKLEKNSSNKKEVKKLQKSLK